MKNLIKNYPSLTFLGMLLTILILHPSCSSEIFTPFEPNEDNFVPQLELPDCIKNCQNHAQTQENFEDYALTLYSEIDNACHNYDIGGKSAYLPDRDLIKMQGHARQHMQFIVKPIPTGKLNPIITFLDSQGQALTINTTQRNDGSTKISILLPNNEPFYIQIEERDNYLLPPIENCNKSYPNAKGGKKYGYLLQTKLLDEADIKGYVAQYETLKKNSITATQQIPTPGDPYYLTFYAPENVNISLKVQPAEGAKSDFKPTIFPLNTQNKNLNWIFLQAHKENKQVLSLTQNDFIAAFNNFGTDPTLKEYAAIIMDIDGKGGPGYSFKMELSVTPKQ